MLCRIACFVAFSLLWFVLIALLRSLMDRASRQRPQDASLLLLLGEAQLDADLTSRAARSLARCLHLAPHSSLGCASAVGFEAEPRLQQRVWCGLAVAAKLRGEHMLALRLLAAANAAAEAAGDVCLEAVIGTGTSLCALGRVADAVRCYQEAERQPRLAQVSSMRVCCAL